MGVTVKMIVMIVMMRRVTFSDEEGQEEEKEEEHNDGGGADVCAMSWLNIVLRNNWDAIVTECLFI